MTASAPNPHQWYRGVPLSAKWPTIIGIATLLVWGGGFAVWAGWAPLNGAVVASGTFVATGQNKLIQHLEGGIVREVLAKEGDLIDAGQTLVHMEETLSNARLRRLVLRSIGFFSMKARLEAEMSGKEELEMPLALAAVAEDAEVKAIVERQRSELAPAGRAGPPRSWCSGRRSRGSRRASKGSKPKSSDKATNRDLRRGAEGQIPAS